MHFISRSHLKEIVRKKTGGDKNTGKTAEEGEGGLSYVWEGLSPQAHAWLRPCTLHTGKESVPKIIINDTTDLFF